MALVDFTAVTAKIKSESDENIDLVRAAEELVMIKQTMGIVTSIWFDFVLPSAIVSNLGQHEIKLLIQAAERDIRNAVKKDKGVILALISAGIALNPHEYSVFVARTLEQIGDPDKCRVFEQVRSYIEMMRPISKRVLYGMRLACYVAGEVELHRMVKRISVYARRKTFERVATRRLRTIVRDLDTYKRKFKLLLDSESEIVVEA